MNNDFFNNKLYFPNSVGLSADDPRTLEYLEQRKMNGFDDTETWSLFLSIANFIVPRLRRFIEVVPGCPEGLTFDQWQEILNKILRTFEIIAEDRFFTNEEVKQLDEGLELFKEWFFALWW